MDYMLRASQVREPSQLTPSLIQFSYEKNVRIWTEFLQTFVISVSVALHLFLCQ